MRPEVGSGVRRELEGGTAGRAPLSSPAQAGPAAALCSVGETVEAGAEVGGFWWEAAALKGRPVLGPSRVGPLGSAGGRVEG